MKTDILFTAKAQKLNACQEHPGLLHFTKMRALVLAYPAILLILMLPFTSGSANVTVSSAIPGQIEMGSILQMQVILSSDAPFSGQVSASPTSSVLTEPGSASFLESDFALQGQLYQASKTFSLTAVSVGQFNIVLSVTGITGEFATQAIGSSVADTIAPQILQAGAAQLQGSEQAQVWAITSENSICRYAGSDIQFDAMPGVFHQTGQKNHSAVYSGQQGVVALYIKCSDFSGNKMASGYPVSFSLAQNSPTARIVLSDPTPVKEGLIELTLFASESLQQAPSLSYSFSDSPGSAHYVPLTGANSVWAGYFTISSGDNNRIGEFSFTGIDLAGNSGSEITEGKLFVADTQKPIAPSSIGITRQGKDTAKLEWYYDGEPVQYFNIYRKDSSGVDYIHSFTSTSGSEYLDSTLKANMSYYYRVSAVDKAGNNGPLSAEVNIQAWTDKSDEDKIAEILRKQQEQQLALENQKEQEETEQAKAIEKPEWEKQAEKLLREAKTLSVDMDWAINNLNSNENPQEKEIIAALQLSLKVSRAKEKLADVEGRISEIRTSDMDSDEKTARLNAISLELKSLRQGSPKNAHIVTRSEFVQAAVDSSVKSGAKLVNSGDRQDEYGQYAVLLQKNVEIKTTLTQILIENIDRSYSNATIISKTAAYNSPDILNNVILMEIVPKQVAQVASDLNIMTSGFEVIQDDPVIGWRLQQFSYQKNQIEYFVWKTVSRIDAEKIQTVVLPDPGAIPAGASPAIVGNVIKSAMPVSWKDIGKIMLWVGFMVVVLLGGYYFVLVRKQQSGEAMILKAEVEEKTGQHFEYLKQLIVEANKELDAGNIDRARVIYSEISGIYKYLPLELKKHAVDSCMKIRHRLERL